MSGFYLFANCNFVPDKYDQWQAGYDELAKYVYAKEPTTQSYYFGIPLDYEHNPSATTSMLAFEVYGKREDLYETHFNSQAMGGFLKAIPSTMTTGLDLTHCEKIGGYIDHPGDKRECAIMQDTRIHCTSAEARKTVSSKLASLAKAVGTAEEDEENGVYTYLAFSSLDTETDLRVFARFETKDDLEKHIRRKDVLDFWFAAKEDVASMESRLYFPNGKGWLHR